MKWLEKHGFSDKTSSAGAGLVCQDGKVFGPSLSAWVDGELSPQEVARVEAHVEACLACRHELEALRGCCEILEQVGDVAIPVELQASLRAAIQSEQSAGICSRVRPLLVAFVDGEITATDRELVALHTDTCQTCSNQLIQMRRTARLVGSLPVVDPPVWLKAQVLAQTSHRPMRRPVLAGVGAALLAAAGIALFFLPSSDHDGNKVAALPPTAGANGTGNSLRRPGGSPSPLHADLKLSQTGSSQGLETKTASVVGAVTSKKDDPGKKDVLAVSGAKPPAAEGVSATPAQAGLPGFNPVLPDESGMNLPIASGQNAGSGIGSSPAFSGERPSTSGKAMSGQPGSSSSRRTAPGTGQRIRVSSTTLQPEATTTFQPSTPGDRMSSNVGSGVSGGARAPRTHAVVFARVTNTDLVQDPDSSHQLTLDTARTNRLLHVYQTQVNVLGSRPNGLDRSLNHSVVLKAAAKRWTVHW